MDNELYSQIISMKNLIIAWRRARKHKAKKDYVIEFERDLRNNLLKLHKELIEQTYSPKLLVTFILRDPKTRIISKSSFRDRIVHHAIINVIEPLFDRCFIYDSCANRIRKGNLFALRRFDEFKRKTSKNNTRKCFVLKADIKHYFEEVNHEILLKIIKRKITDEKIILLILKILDNFEGKEKGNSRPDFKDNCSSLLKSNRSGMPLGNLTSQFFANVYLNELDYFVKHKLGVKYYLRYVDDFVILHESKEQLEIWKIKIEEFLKQELKIELHPQKSKIILLSRGVDFVGFRNFYHYRLLRKRNIRNMKRKIDMFKQGLMSKDKFLESFQGWSAYAKWADSYNLRMRLKHFSSVLKKFNKF